MVGTIFIVWFVGTAALLPAHLLAQWAVRGLVKEDKNRNHLQALAFACALATLVGVTSTVFIAMDFRQNFESVVNGLLLLGVSVVVLAAGVDLSLMRNRPLRDRLRSLALRIGIPLLAGIGLLVLIEAIWK